jgi:glucose/arabinose dehydrogenase
MRRRTSPLVALVATLAVLAAACSDDDVPPVASSPDVTFATTAPTTSTTPETTPETTTEATSPATTEAPPTTTPLTGDSVSYTLFVEGLNKPVDLAWRANDATMYIVQQDGFIIPIDDGVAGSPVLDIAGDVSSGNEQGLLGLAFHPTEPLAYVNLTRGNGDTVIREYVVGDDGVFDPASEREVLVIAQPYSNHNGGDLTFGPDGYLYIGMGDGGAANDPERRSLNVTELLGKMLRIDPLVAGDQPYSVPADNPFVDVAGARPEIWSVGVRNPWRFNFDTATGDLWIADVGQGQWEEINLVTQAQGGGRGINFGWSAWEGNHPFNGDQSPDGATPPIFEYEHGDAGCSVSGGTVYRGSNVPSLVGWYVFSDYCSGLITALQATDGMLTGEVALGQLSNVSAICNGPDEEMYVLSLGDGTVHRIDPA